MNIETQRKAMLGLSRRKWLAFELLKQEWQREHPKAPPGEYNTAMRKIVDELGL